MIITLKLNTISHSTSDCNELGQISIFRLAKRTGWENCSWLESGNSINLLLKCLSGGGKLIIVTNGFNPSKLCSNPPSRCF